jgi:DNA-directed RNA polymerase specialized sigma24 family protein
MMVDNSVLEEFEKQFSEETLQRLTSYVLRIKKISVLLQGSTQFPRGSTKEDIALKAIEDTLTGERKWNMEKHPNLYSHLISTVNSIVSNHFKSFEKNNRDLPSDIFEENDYSSFFDAIVSDSNPRIIVEANEIKEQCFKLVENDPELSDLLLYIIEGYERKDISTTTGKSITEINNSMKRLLRKLKPIFCNTKGKIDHE